VRIQALRGGVRARASRRQDLTAQPHHT
jgi:hypothetical protein